ncbi:MAG: CPBP family intramembrane metalloprotease [Myxococcales bacterium]|nr:MAG: CPBP family intramembrane metalloprotease [Myxococcales bacterium]
MQKGQLRWWQAAALSLCFLCVAFLTMFFAGFLQAESNSAAQHIPMDKVTRDPLNILFAQAAGALVAVGLGLRWLGSDKPAESLGLQKNPQIHTLIFAVLAGFSLQFPLTELSNALRTIFPVSIEEQIAVQRMLNPSHWLGAFETTLAIVLVAPLSEEVLFRGIMIRGLNARYGKVVAVILSALLFGLAHMGIIELVYASIVGILLGLLYLSKQNLWTCITLHASFNAAPLVLPSRLIPIEGFNLVSENVQHLRPDLFSASALLFAFSFYFLMK